ncbi:MAG: hypothetical protein ACHQZQ_01170 [SAR324 cluster bacterium]
MRALKTSLVALGLVCGLLTGAGVTAQEKESNPLQLLMGRNFDIVARMLSDLVQGRYDSLQMQAELMVRHATDLAAAAPDGHGAAERAVFLAYATNLRLAASQLLTVSERLAKQGQQPGTPGNLSVDYLRSAAAQHFGNVVTACALCHSQFRPQLL